MTFQGDDVNNIVFLFTGIILFSSLAGFIIYFIFIYRNKQRRFELEKKEMAMHYQQALLEVEMEIREQTLSYVARELHDHIGQMALLIKLHLSSLDTESESNSEKISEARDISVNLIRDIKQLSKGLKNYDLLREGLSQAIETEAARIQKTGALEIHVQAPDDSGITDKEKEIFIFRMFQEIMNNIVQHASASDAWIEIKRQEKYFVLCIRDNGKGLDLAANIRGSGLENLHERSKLIGARLELSSNPGEGTRVCITIPF